MSRLLKIVLAPMILILATALLAACVSDPTVAVVNGEKLSKSELDEMLNKRAGRQMLDQLINEKLVLQEAKKNKIHISEKSIDKRIIHLKKQFPNEADWNKNLRQNNVTIDDVKDQVKLQLTIQKLQTGDEKKYDSPQSLMEDLKSNAKITVDL